MGQGQFTIALQQLHDSARAGDWLILKNLHLVSSWLPTLEKEINTLQPAPSFRLFMTSEAHPKFSSVLLQSSLKVLPRLFPVHVASSLQLVPFRADGHA